MIIDGRKIADTILENIKEEVSLLKEKNARIPKLVVVQVGENPASTIYVRNKVKTCQRVGIESEVITLDESETEDKLLSVIHDLNHDHHVDGILVQLPLPSHINEIKVIENINPNKDVDGFHPTNIAKLFLGNGLFEPCTPKGIMELLKYSNYDLSGKRVVVIGRSNIVGKPVALLALHQNATVTICHSKSKNLKMICKEADVLIAAVGKAKMVDRSYIKDGAVIIDVGMNRVDGKLYGDVDFDDVVDHVSLITPVPKGVGPMTIAMLLKNTLIAYKNKE